MFLYEIFRILIGAQVTTTCTLFTNSTCPGSSFNAITAAFATQGYWVQADLLYFLNFSSLTALPIMIYIIAAAGGLISMALGSPPKMYIWFFMGPPIFNWLVGTTWPVHGVRVNVGRQSSMYGIPLPTSLQSILGFADSWNATIAQTEVWKLAEPGLLNTNIVKRGDYVTSSYTEPFGGPNGDGTVDDAWFFVYFDYLVSGMVEWMTEWTGVYDLEGGNNDYSTIMANPMQIGGGQAKRQPNHLLRDLKWKMIEDVTGAKLSNPDLRDTFATFMQSECGDDLSRSISKENFAAAMHSESAVPDSVFKVGSGSQYNTDIERKVLKNLSQDTIPTPISLQHFLFSFDSDSRYGRTASLGSFENSSKLWSEQELTDIRNYGAYANASSISCTFFMRFIIDAFRWEAGHIYYQMLQAAPAGISPKTLVYNLFYGWPGRDDLASRLPIHIPSIPGTFLVLDAEKQQHFLQDLILVHLFRNEMAIAPQPYMVRKGSSEETVDYAYQSAKTVGSKSRFGELYTWALLMPYLQGLLLYVLAIAYPIVCCFTLMPGMHKILFTWMSFFVWAKLWDFGFALVTVLERSVWAMIGNRSEIGAQFAKVYKMSQYGKVNVMCPGNTSPIWQTPQGSILGLPGNLVASPFNLCGGAAIPDVKLITNGGSQTENLGNVFHIFDSAVSLAGSLDLDLSNTWYIYIMAALFFAVPAVTGQLVLGAKAGAASLLQTAIGQQAAEAGKGAAQGYSGQLGQMLDASSNAVAQTSTAKSLRSGPANASMRNALDAGNKAMRNELLGSAASTTSSQLGNKAKAISDGIDKMQAMYNVKRAEQGLVPYGVGYGQGVTQSLEPGSYGGTLAKGVAGLAGLAGVSMSSDYAGSQVGYDPSTATAGVNRGGGTGQAAGGGANRNGAITAGGGGRSAATTAGGGGGTGGGGGGTGGGATRGSSTAGGNWLVDGLGKLGGLTGDAAQGGFGSIAQSAQQLGNFVGANDGYLYKAERTDRNNAIDAQQGMAGVAGLEASGRGRAWGATQQGFYDPQTRQIAGEERFRDTNAYSAQVSGMAAAAGVQIPPRATPKPMEERGMASTGYLGGDLYNLANWSNPNNSAKDSRGNQADNFSGFFGGTGSWAYNGTSMQLYGGTGVLGGVNENIGSGAITNEYGQHASKNMSQAGTWLNDQNDKFARTDSQGNIGTVQPFSARTNRNTGEIYQRQVVGSPTEQFFKANKPK
jgi:hypothetical protein